MLTSRATQTADGPADGQSSDDDEPGSDWRGGAAFWRRAKGGGTLPTILSSEALLTVRVQRRRRVTRYDAAARL